MMCGSPGAGTGDACDPNHNKCSTTITVPKVLASNQQGMFSTALDNGGTADSITWTVVTGEQFLDLTASDPLPHVGPTLSLTAGASGGGQVMLMAVIMNGGQTCVAEFTFSIISVELLDAAFMPASFLDIGHWGADRAPNELTGYTPGAQGALLNTQPKPSSTPTRTVSSCRSTTPTPTPTRA